MKKYKILVDLNIPLLSNCLANHSIVMEFEGRKLSKQDILDFDASLLFVRSTTIVNKDLLEGTNVRFVATATSGSEHFDKAYLDSKGIVYSDSIGSNALSVAEYVIFSILHYQGITKSSIIGKNIGLIGYGNVGKRVAYYANLLGMNVFACDPPLFDTGFFAHSKLNHYALEYIFENCDVITNHVNYERDGKYPTINLINANLLKKAKANVLLIHTSRGGIANEADLIEFARNKKITLVCDVWENEPNVSKNAALAAMIATPHIAGHSYDGKLKGTLKMAQHFEEFTGYYVDKSTILNELSNTNYIDINSMSENDIYPSLLKSRDLLSIHQQFINTFSTDYAGKEFDLMRKNYPIQREIFKDIL